MQHDAAAIARMLAARISALTAELLPSGRRQGHEWVHPSLTGTSQRSLSVHLSGSKAGVWADFASGDRGDALDLVAVISCGGDKRAALSWARSWLGLGGAAAIPSARPVGAGRRETVPATSSDDDADEERRRRAATSLFLHGRAQLRDTPVAAYLAGRGIDLSELGRQPGSLRYHPAVWNREAGCSLPCMLAAISGGGEHVTAVHRTWLAQDHEGRWRKAPLNDPKMSLGRVSGGTIRLWRGASSRSLAQAPAGDRVAIGEGIETCLSVVVACPELRVLSCVSLANMANVVLPAAIGTVILLRDNDGDNPATLKAFARAEERFAREGRMVLIADPPIGKDFNDSLVAGADQ